MAPHTHVWRIRPPPVNILVMANAECTWAAAQTTDEWEGGLTIFNCRFLNLIVFVLFSSAAQADVLFVDDNCPGPGNGSELDPYCSIQTAIDNAVDTDEIVVASGTYSETINFIGKAITLRSSGGPGVTIIDAGGSPGAGTVVTCESGEGPNTVLEGFTITGGDAPLGGGMRNVNSSPTVIGCVFSNNVAFSFDGHGGGMYNENCSPTVTNCTFSGNIALGNNVGSGGGMFNENANPTVIGCTFTENTAPFSLSAGGGMVNSYSNPVIINCLFHANFAATGSGMINFVADPTMTNCTFTGNGSRFAILNYLSNPVLTNCILWANNSGQMVDWSSSSTVSYSAIQGGWPGTGNLDADPLFVDPDNGDYRLSAGSPCVDAGDNTAVPNGVLRDLDGNPRFVADACAGDSGATVDMGAYEFQGTSCNLSSMLALLAAWGSCSDCGRCLYDFDGDCSVGILDLLILLGNWGP